MMTLMLGLCGLFSTFKLPLFGTPSDVLGLATGSSSDVPSFFGSHSAFPFFHTPIIFPWLFFLSFFVGLLIATLCVNSITGLVAVAEAGEAGSEGSRPMFLRISSFGDVAISSSRGEMILALAGASFGTILSIVPSGIFSTVLLIFHLFALEGCAGAEVVAGEAKVMEAAARACVAGVGVSVPLRLKMERLRRLMPFWLG
jgi:hypothetical protein